MSWLIALITLNLLFTFGLGIYREFRPIHDPVRATRAWRGSLAANLAVFAGAGLAMRWWPVARRRSRVALVRLYAALRIIHRDRRLLLLCVVLSAFGLLILWLAGML